MDENITKSDFCTPWFYFYPYFIVLSPTVPRNPYDTHTEMLLFCHPLCPGTHMTHTEMLLFCHPLCPGIHSYCFVTHCVQEPKWNIHWNFRGVMINLKSSMQEKLFLWFSKWPQACNSKKHVHNPRKIMCSTQNPGENSMQTIGKLCWGSSYKL